MRSTTFRASLVTVGLQARLIKTSGANTSITLDLLVIQIDGLRVGDHVLVAAIGIDGAGDKHVLAVALGPSVHGGKSSPPSAPPLKKLPPPRGPPPSNYKSSIAEAYVPRVVP